MVLLWSEALTARQYLEFVTSIIRHFINVSISVEDVGLGFYPLLMLLLYFPIYLHVCTEKIKKEIEMVL